VSYLFGTQRGCACRLSRLPAGRRRTYFGRDRVNWPGKFSVSRRRIPPGVISSPLLTFPDALVTIWRQEGAKSLWSGTGPSLLLVSNPAVQFMVYEALKRECQSIFHTQELSAFVYFVIGALAKAAATIVTYPVQVVQSRLRVSRVFKHASSPSN